MREEIDFSRLIENIGIYRHKGSVQDAVSVMQAMRALRRSRLPGCYVDGLQDELLAMICERVPNEVCDHVYLAFHGPDGRASHMKVGVAKDVKKRMDSLYTGNPLPRLWVYAAKVAGRNVAMNVESALLHHMRADVSRGEWIDVGGLSKEASVAVVRSLEEVATERAGKTVEFSVVDMPA